MSRKIHPGRVVTFTRDHVVVNPATVVQSKSVRDGSLYVIAEIPETRTVYRAGQTCTFGSVNAARDFVRALCKDAPDVCYAGPREETS